MDRLSQQLAAARQSHQSLAAAFTLQIGPVERRDIAIMRFIYTFETMWKASRLFLAEHHAMEVNSPKSSVRAAMEVGLLTPDEAKVALAMAEDRNLSVHAYNEKLAEALFSRLPRHTEVLGTWLKAMTTRVAKSG